MRLTVNQLEAAHQIWDEVSAFPAGRVEEALIHLMKAVANEIEADNAVWVGAIRLSRSPASSNDPQRGWRGLAVRHMLPVPLVLDRGTEAAKQQDTDPALTTRALVANAGAFRVSRLRDGFVDFKSFQKTLHYRVFYKEVGITDRMFIGTPVNKDAEGFLLFDRFHRKKQFTVGEATFAAHVLRGLKWFHRELLLSLGLLVAKEPLTVTEQRIVSLLLTEKSEKEIAAELNQTPTTTHKYITGILRKFGVSGRTGLLALWLGRQG